MRVKLILLLLMTALVIANVYAVGYDNPSLPRVVPAATSGVTYTNNTYTNITNIYQNITNNYLTNDSYIPFTNTSWKNLTEDNMADTLHRHSELSASDGSPNPALQVDASGNVGIGIVPTYTLDANTASNTGIRAKSTNAGGESQTIVWNDADKYVTMKQYGSTIGGTLFGVTRNNLATIYNVADNFAIGNYFDTPLIFGVNNAEYMRINAGGNIGIGNTAPDRILHLTGATPFLRVTPTADAQVNGIEFTNTAKDKLLFVRREANDDMGMWVQGNQMVEITPNYFGIKTTTPRQALDVAGIVTASNYYIRSADNAFSGRLVDGGTYLTLDAYNGADWTSRNMRIQGNEIYFLDGATTEVMRLKNGIVGIGTVTPNRNLETSGTGNVVNRITGDDAFLELRDKSTNNQMSFQFTDGNNLQLRYGASLGATAYSTTDLVSFKPDGKVGIGTTSPTHTLNVVGSANITQNLIVEGNLSVKVPYGMFSSTEDQTLALADTAYPVTFNWTEDSHQIYKEGNSNFSVGQSGDYLVELSAIFQSAVANKKSSIWVQIYNSTGSWNNVPRSNTQTTMRTLGSDYVVAVPFILDIHTNEKFRIMWAGDDAGIFMNYMTNTSYAPETPSIIMTITKVSDVTP